jgi:hypothetical protein
MQADVVDLQMRERQFARVLATIMVAMMASRW